MTKFEHTAITCALLIPAALLFIIATANLFTHGDFTNAGIGCAVLLGCKVWLDEWYARELRAARRDVWARRDDEAGLW